jgi:hypothetical protein
MLLKRKKRKVKFQYGFKVPRNVNEAYKFDKENGDTKWIDAIQKEGNLLKDEYQCFDIKASENQITCNRRLCVLSV